MTGRTVRNLATALVLLLSRVAAASAQANEPGSESPRLQAVRLAAEEAIRLDGSLDEPAWGRADSISGFRQREPLEGAPATERTVVRVLYDEAYLYIGVRAYDSEPGRVVARQLERDAPLGLSRFGPAGADDAIELILDTFHDRRNAYYFATNPNGALVDGLITDESESPDLNWDAVWDVRARKTGFGWSAELAIPLRSIRFRSAPGEQVWGFNVQRTVVRKNEQTLWTAWSRDNEGLHRIGRAGELTGLEGLTSRVNAYIKPYGLGEAGQDYLERPDGDAKFDPKIGGDAKIALASGLTLDLTVNTDFAQVEADEEQINLTRFNLFFPEKREFFLENAGIFEFGAPQFFGPPDLLLFFSRRIGLQRLGFAGAEPVPMLGGARLTGRAGRQTLGVLNVVTGRDDELNAPLTNFAVARVKRDVGRSGYVGGIVTHRYQEGGATNLAAGADLSLWLSQPLVFQAFFAGTEDSGPGGDDIAWQAKLDYTGDWFGWLVQHQEIGPELSPEVGFVRRLNVGRTTGGFRLTPRPPIPGLRRINIFNSFQYVVSHETRGVLDRTWELSVTPQLDAGDELRLQTNYQFQRLVESFDLTPGDSVTPAVSVPPGDYEDWTFSASIQTAASRALSAELSGGFGGFWDGDRWSAGAAVKYNSPHVGVELGYSHNDVDVPGGAFTTDLVQTRIQLAASTRLFGNALIQYNSQTGAFSANLRIDWIHRPGSDLFIVFNERRNVEGGVWEPVSRAFVVKVTYLKWM
ncbi:MAG: carbohydrate binding family 9 domain-containing protein [Gemmatimonadetes bacterium]|uniref:Carbohydrate binding family 9 domain-containing protein n=1 Tax=Candidatus Kutchimonas denitrificans TaxID=3056748 RepID=A0AAE5CBE0_9BACT|nr:carbohydrate binding family 9 domain-containing protein [Gemmatimonadota bacterium]NIR74463.1 carbohydrate binding family 9 domain-containing protein [Candidatus Kutchimonas denitrificans]NIS00859.1 carbohydrate binding family 9 domain-containing protein [Gemmatimonadota bacterium]NIT66482.1 carbohydrate binding family 9 domain-containing protein [Gemmatimonadota bacterium]NIU52113.1 hypothetical protein [Gemmatimonadota bacterium]